MKASLWFLVALLVAMPVSFLTDPEEFTNNELIRAYCKLVKRKHFYRYHKLKENGFQLLQWMKNKKKHFATSNTMTKIIKHPKYKNK